MALIRIFLLSLGLMASSISLAWETDNFTCRTKKIKDVSEILNKETNNRIKEALSMANSMNSKHLERYKKMVGIRELMMSKGEMSELDFIDEMEGWTSEDPQRLDVKFRGLDLKNIDMAETCSKPLLETVLASKIASPWMGNLESWAMEAPIPKCTIPVKDSVFSALSITESPVAKSAGINSVINVNGHYIGVDKLSHFMTEGLHYQQAARKTTAADEKLKAALAVGTDQEEGGYGWSATGVKSYADMAANYQGYGFWKNLYEGDNPYFVCENKKWKQVREFDWKEYVDDSFDESINCNEYKTKEMNDKIDAESARRWEAAGLPERKCPASTESCSQLKAKIYSSQVREAILHPRCNGNDNASIPTPAKNPSSYNPNTPYGGVR